MKLQEILFVAFFVLILSFLSTLLHSWLGNFKIKYNLETLGIELNNWLNAKKVKNYVENARLIDYVNYHEVPFHADDNQQNISSAIDMSLKKIIHDYTDHYNINLEFEQEVECVVYFPKLALYEIFSKLKNEVPQPTRFLLLKRNCQQIYELEHSNYVFLKNLDLHPRNYIDDQSFLIMCGAPRLICDDSMTAKMAQKVQNKNAIMLSSKVSHINHVKTTVEISKYRDTKTTVGILTSFKNEAANIEEWLRHYAFEGVTQFVFIDRNSTDSTKELINNFIQNWHESKIYVAILPQPKQNTLVNQLRHYDHFMTTTWAIHVQIDQFVYARQKYRDIVSFAENIPEGVDSIYLFWKVFNIPDGAKSLINDCTKTQSTESCFGIGQTMYRVNKLPGKPDRVRLKNLHHSTGSYYTDASGKKLNVDQKQNFRCKLSDGFDVHLNYYKRNISNCDQEDTELKRKQRFRIEI